MRLNLWQGWWDLNPQMAVLETAGPNQIARHPYVKKPTKKQKTQPSKSGWVVISFWSFVLDSDYPVRGQTHAEPAIIPLAVNALMLSGGRIGVFQSHCVPQLLYTTMEIGKKDRIIEIYFFRARYPSVTQAISRKQASIVRHSLGKMIQRLLRG
jgi:hypothetical protein